MFSTGQVTIRESEILFSSLSVLLSTTSNSVASGICLLLNEQSSTFRFVMPGVECDVLFNFLSGWKTDSLEFRFWNSSVQRYGGLNCSYSSFRM